MIEASLLAIVIDCLCMVENPENDTEAGILQIQPVMVEDLNRIAGLEKWTLADRRNPFRSRIMAMDYLLHYGDGMDAGQLADLWHRGPTGCKRPMKLADKDYVDRVVALMEKIMEGGK